MSSFIMNMGYEDMLYLAPYISPELELAVKNFVERLPAREAQFAALRYGKRLTIEQVSEQMGYSPRHIYRVRKRVLALWCLFVKGRGLEGIPADLRQRMVVG